MRVNVNSTGYAWRDKAETIGGEHRVLEPLPDGEDCEKELNKRAYTAFWTVKPEEDSIRQYVETYGQLGAILYIREPNSDWRAGPPSSMIRESLESWKNSIRELQCAKEFWAILSHSIL